MRERCLSKWRSLRVFCLLLYLNHQLLVFLDSAEVLLCSEVELVYLLAVEAALVAACSARDNPNLIAVQVTSIAKKQTQTFTE